MIAGASNCQAALRTGCEVPVGHAVPRGAAAAASRSALQQHEERPCPDAPEDPDVQRHQGRNHPQQTIQRAFRGQRLLRRRPRQACLLGALLIQILRRGGPWRRRARRPHADGALRHPHRDVLDEGADERRVVADAGNAEPGLAHGALEIGNVGERVQVIALAQAFLPQIHQPDALEAARERVDALEPAGEPRVLPHVRVDEDVPARRSDSRDLAEHVRQRLRRQVLEHVERVALREGPVGKRQPPQIAEHEVSLRQRFRGEIRRHVDADERGAALVVPDDRSAAAAPEVDDHDLRGPASGSAAASTGGRRPAAAAATRSRGVRRHAAPRRGTSSAR